MGTRNWELQEWKLIHERRQRAFDVGEEESTDSSSETPKRPERLIGLTLSGGGIRSALYNDGFLQGLSHRGFLRFVDYLASVSGGGYIAGHLIAQAKPKPSDENERKSQPCFHDDAPKPAEVRPPRWHLGRDPQNGAVDHSRLAGVGGYLSRPLEILPAYLWACFFSVAFYIGCCGILATLTAIFWRSFDDPNFRILFVDFLRIRVGDELLIAFIPTLLLFLAYFIAEVSLSSIRWICGLHKPRLQRFHTSARALSLVILSLAVLTSIAVFLGNGTTNISSNAQGSIYLNHYAQWLAIIAGTLQVLVFFGSDKLFRSERQQAKQWQKTVQRVVSVGVTFFLVFSMIHWMARENISEFVDHRDPYLVRGDVTDWRTLHNVFNQDKVDKPDQPVSLDIDDHLPVAVRAKSTWAQTLAARRWEWISLVNRLGKIDESKVIDKSYPKEFRPSDLPPPSWNLEQRFYGAVWAYFYSYTTCRKFENEDVTSIINESKTLKSFQDFAKTDKNLDTNKPLRVTKTVKAFAEWLPLLNAQQDMQLRIWNDRLDDPTLTKELIEGMLSTKDESDGAKPLNVAVSKDFTSFVESKFTDFSPRERKALATVARRIAGLDHDKIPNTINEKSENTRTKFAEVNRILLERLFPDAVRTKNIPSTMVVPPYDQQARRSWLGFWLLLATVGALGGVFRHQVATVFKFYRRQLGNNFLVPSDNRDDSRGEVPIYQLEPTSDGLPYPLMLAASMEPVMVNGSYKIQSKTFMFTPTYCGYMNDDKNRIVSKQVALSRGERAKSLTLADAVTLSGAAVSPLMTTNRCLSLLVDVFNTGLGMQLYRTEKCDEASEKSGNVGLFIAVVAAIIFAFFFFWVSDYRWGYLGLSLIFALTIGICLVGQTGVPYFLKLLVAPKEIGPSAAKRTTDYSRKSFYVADGGFTDYLGVTALLERRCELIVISDAGANVGDDHLGTLAKMCESASTDMGIRFLDLDHEAPIDFGRLKFDERRLVHQPYLCMRVRYPDATEGLVIYCQMAISDTDPIEIQQIRNRFPKFPDEPTVNQFYTDDQVAAYRSLGYHIASRMCRELERWCVRPDSANSKEQICVETSKASSALEVGEQNTSEFNRFSDALMNRNAMKQKLIGGNVPKFEVLRERLLTAYRLACYEEVSYRKDDIFSEAVWPMSQYAFPNFRSHASKLRIEKDSSALECAEAWLRTYESSADVRSAYRKAVLEDINVLEREVESYSAAIYFRLAEIAGTSVACHSLLAAHMASLAVTCQEVHRGRPHSAFQIGGRRKLVEMCSKIAKTMMETLKKSPTSDDDDQLRASLGNIIAELMELERSVFQGSEHVTTISFAQCVSVMWGRLIRGEPMRKENLERISNRAKAAFEASSGTSTESRMLKARQELDRGLKRVNLESIGNTLTRLWYLGYFNIEAGHVLDDKAFHGFDFLGFHDVVSPLAKIADSVEMQRLWLVGYDKNKDIRRGYEEALREDSGAVVRGIDARSTELFRKLRNTASAISDKASLDYLTSAHFAATAVACIRQKRPDTNVDFTARRRLSPYTACKLLGKLVIGRCDDGGSKSDDLSNENALSFVQNVKNLSDCIFEKTDSIPLGRFARSALNIWTGMIRNERDANDLNFNFAKAADALETLELVGEFTKDATVDALDAQFGEAIMSNEKQAVEMLSRLWYVSLIDRTEFDTESTRRPIKQEIAPNVAHVD